MRDNNIMYDTSCVSVQYSTNATLLWPFTNDVMPVPRCDIGIPPSLPFPGLYAFISHINFAMCEDGSYNLGLLIKITSNMI